MSYANWLLRGTDSAGRIYAVDSTATTVLFNYNNDAKGLAEAIQLALRCYPEISSTGTYDSQVGVRFYINPTGGNYGDIAGATEITQFIIPQQTVTTTGTILAGVLTLGRLARTMIVEVDAGGVGVTLNTLTVTGAQSGDSVTLYAKGGTSFTVNMGGGNMYSGNTDADYTSTSVKNRITLTYNGTNWDDDGRVEQNAVSVTDLRAASIPQSPTGVTSIALVNGGATNTLLAQTNGHSVRLTGSGYNLTGNNNFNGGGTPIEGDTFTIYGNGATCSYAGGGNILVQGETVPTDMASNGWWVATLAYMSAAWVCTAIVPDFTQSQFIVTSQIKDLNVTTGKVNDLAITTGKINDLAVTNAKIANATIDASTKVTPGSIDQPLMASGSIGVNELTTDMRVEFWPLFLSFEAGEQAWNQLRCEYQGSITMLHISVVKTLAGVDAGTITIESSTLGVIQTLTIPAGTVQNSFTTVIGAGGTIPTGDDIFFKTSKATAGGKVLLSVEFLKS